MDLAIRGRNAIVCASSRGLGRACAEALAAAGCNVVVNGRDAETTRAVALSLSARFGVTATPVVADISTAAGQRAILDACPHPDILVNNNGGPPRRDFRDLDRASILAGVTQNLVTPVELIQATIDGMAERGFGRIVNITSLSVLTPIPGLDLSSAARAGLTAFLAGVIRPFSARNVTVNNMLPGKFDTDRLRGGFAAAARAAKTSVDAVAERQRDEIPAKRFGDPAEFGAMCAFLCSAHAGYITGQNIVMDGGLFVRAF